MIPDEAEGFYEDDEDPAVVFAKFDAGPHVATKRPGGMPEYARGGVITASGTGDAVPFTVSERPHGHVSWARQYIASRYGSGGDAQ